MKQYQFYQSCMKAVKNVQTACPQLELGNLSAKVISTALCKSLNHKYVVVKKITPRKLIWRVLGSKMLDPFVRDLIHDILPLNSLLFKRYISHQLTCVLCEMVPETVMHLLIHCQTVRPLFCILESWFRTITKSNAFILTHDFIKYHLLPMRCDPDVCNVLLALITEFKYAIWLRRLSNQRTICSCIAHLNASDMLN